MRNASGLAARRDAPPSMTPPTTKTRKRLVQWSGWRIKHNGGRTPAAAAIAAPATKATFHRLTGSLGDTRQYRRTSMNLAADVSSICYSNHNETTNGETMNHCS